MSLPLRWSKTWQKKQLYPRIDFTVFDKSILYIDRLHVQSGQFDLLLELSLAEDNAAYQDTLIDIVDGKFLVFIIEKEE